MVREHCCAKLVSKRVTGLMPCGITAFLETSGTTIVALGDARRLLLGAFVMATSSLACESFLQHWLCSDPRLRQESTPRLSKKTGK